MDRRRTIKYLRKEIERIQDRIKTLQKTKADSDGPRTSWHSHQHLDIEQELEANRNWLSRCQQVLSTIEEARSHSRVSAGSIVKISINGELEDYIIVDSGGGSVESFSVISIQCPVGRAIKGKKVGDTVTTKVPGGELTIKIIQVE